MKAFFKEHFVLIFGISLPLILSLVFFMSANIKKATETPPKYDFLFASRYYPQSPDHPYRFNVNADGQLELNYRGVKEVDRGYEPEVPLLYVYRADKDQIELVDMPDIDKSQKGSYVIEDLGGASVSDQRRSPDGYQFLSYYRNSGNLMTEVFGAGGHRSRYVVALEKDGYEKRLDTDNTLNFPGGYYYGDGVFVGWIVETNTK